MKNIKQKYNFIQFLDNKNNLLKVVPLTLPGQKSDLHVTAFWFVHVVFLHRCQDLTFESIHNCVGIWSCLSCSSKPLDTGFVTRCFGFSSFENCQAATIRLRSCTSCLKSDSPKFICWCLRKSALSYFLNSFSWISRYLLSFFFGTENTSKTALIFQV